MSHLLEEKIKQIQEKLQLLVKQNATIRKENQSLKEALAQSKQTAVVAVQNAEALQHQLDAKKYSQASMSAEERKVFEKKINNYVKEIEKCIALLSVG